MIVKKISALILIFNLCFLPVFTQTLKKSEKDSRYSKVKLTVKSINIGNKKKREKPEPKKNYDRFEYDKVGRITKVISKDKGIIKINYDEYGGLKSKIRSNLEYEYYHYDKLGRNTKIVYESKGNKDTVDFKYSTLEESYKLGYLTEKIEKNEHSFYKYEGRRLIEEKKLIGSREFRVKYKYNDKGLLSEIYYPSGLIVSYEYNDKNKIENVFVVRNKIRSEVLKYIKRKDSTSLQYGNGLDTTVNDDIEAKTIKMKTGDIQDLEFRFNDKGLIEKVIDKKVRRNKKEFYYDQYERLITAYGPWGKISYRYDSMDNLTKKIEKDYKLKLSYDKKSSKIKKLIENDTNVIVKYDQLGRMTKYGSITFSYNERGRLGKIIKGNEVQVELFYNFKNQRVIEKHGDEEYYFVYDNGGRILSQYNQKGKSMIEYIHTPSDYLIGFVQDNKIYYYHYDIMNFPIMVSDESAKMVNKVKYKPYGGIVSIEGDKSNSLRFPGQFEIYKTNLYYNLNRTYFPKLTRYLEPDPALYNREENNYQYALANPLKYYDLMGLQCYGNKIWVYRSDIDSYMKPVTLILKFDLLKGGVSVKLKGVVKTACYCKHNKLYMFRYKVDLVVKTPFFILDILKYLSKYIKYLERILSEISKSESKWHIKLTSKRPMYPCPNVEEFKGYFKLLINWRTKEMRGTIGNMNLEGMLVEKPKHYEFLRDKIGKIEFEGKHKVGGILGILGWFNILTSGTEENCRMNCETIDDLN